MNAALPLPAFVRVPFPTQSLKTALPNPSSKYWCPLGWWESRKLQLQAEGWAHRPGRAVLVEMTGFSRGWWWDLLGARVGCVKPTARSQGLSLGHLGGHHLLVPVPVPLGCSCSGGFPCALGLQLHHLNPGWDQGKARKETLSVGSDLRQETCMREVEFRGC